MVNGLILNVIKINARAGTVMGEGSKGVKNSILLPHSTEADFQRKNFQFKRYRSLKKSATFIKVTKTLTVTKKCENFFICFPFPQKIMYFRRSLVKV